MTDCLAQHRWQHRVLLAFAPALDARAIETQKVKINAGRAGFTERDMVLIAVSPNDLREEGMSAPRSPDLFREEARSLYERFSVEPGTTAILLIGKDGTEKARWSEPVDLAEVFGLIDAMPMRQREMRERAE